MMLLTNVIENIVELALPMDIVRISEADFKRLEQQTNNTDRYWQQLDKLKFLFHTFEKVYVTENVQFTSNPYRTELFVEPNFYRNTVSATYSTQISDTSRITITKNYTDFKLRASFKNEQNTHLIFFKDMFLEQAIDTIDDQVILQDYSYSETIQIHWEQLRAVTHHSLLKAQVLSDDQLITEQESIDFTQYNYILHFDQKNHPFLTIKLVHKKSLLSRAEILIIDDVFLFAPDIYKPFMKLT